MSKCILFAGLMLFCSFRTPPQSTFHKYYVSVTQIEFAEKKQSLQIVSRLFVDDLEEVLKDKNGKKFRIPDIKRSKEVEDQIKRYLSSKFRLSIDKKSRSVNYLGHKIENDLLIAFMEVTNTAKFEQLEVQNRWLFEEFSEQKNIIHFKNDKKRRSLILDYDTPFGVLKF